MRKYRLKNGAIGVTKEFDNLWRLVIPKEMRDLYKFGKEVEIVTTIDGILIRNPEYRMVKVGKRRDETKESQE